MKVYLVRTSVSAEDVGGVYLNPEHAISAAEDICAKTDLPWQPSEGLPYGDIFWRYAPLPRGGGMYNVWVEEREVADALPPTQNEWLEALRNLLTVGASDDEHERALAYSYVAQHLGMDPLADLISCAFIETATINEPGPPQAMFEDLHISAGSSQDNCRIHLALFFPRGKADARRILDFLEIAVRRQNSRVL